MTKLDFRLTRLQSALHDYLRANSGETFSREQLCLSVWKMNFYPNSRTIDQTISVVRKHLGQTERIITVHGVGYRYEERSRVSTQQWRGRTATAGNEAATFLR